jgi:hypothetical protein
LECAGLRSVAEIGGKAGLTIERFEVVDALAGLIQDGLAKAYLLSCKEPFSTVLPGMPSLEILEEDFKTYFYITKKGVDFLASDDWWGAAGC